MKKLFLVLFLILFSSSFASAMTTISGRPAPGGVAVAGNTNYCNDANAQLCLYMNGANSADETDHSANGYTITQNNGITSSSTVPSGYSGKSRSFASSSTQHFYCGNSTCANLQIANQAFTMMAWVNASTVPASASSYGIMRKYATSGNQRQYALLLTGTGSSQFKFATYLSTSGTAATVNMSSTTTTYVGSTWYHAAVVYNGTDVRIYVNGSLDCTPASMTGNLYDGTAPFRIGTETNSSETVTNLFYGLIDEVAVFNRALSASEVQDIYTNGLTGNKGGSD